MWKKHKKSQSRIREQQKKTNEWIDWLQVIIDQLLFIILYSIWLKHKNHISTPFVWKIDFDETHSPLTVIINRLLFQT